MIEQRRTKKGTFCIVMGCFLILAGMGLDLEEIQEAHHAEIKAHDIVEELKPQIPEIPDTRFTEYPERTMPTVITEESRCIGIIQIPALEVELPVSEECNYQLMKQGACCYHGSAYQNNLVLAAHNYRSHFGRIGELSAGSQIVFHDFEGNQHEYQVIWQEILAPDETDKMTENSGQWDLTLFTCTWSGTERIAVRCVRV